jgi:hypothetical protein
MVRVEDDAALLTSQDLSTTRSRHREISPEGLFAHGSRRRSALAISMHYACRWVGRHP